VIFLPDYIWHITTTAIRKNFFSSSRVIVAVTCAGYSKPSSASVRRTREIVISNHIHLLAKDTGSNVIPESFQLIAGAYREGV
jgi:hypothetical protein